MKNAAEAPAANAAAVPAGPEGPISLSGIEDFRSLAGGGPWRSPYLRIDQQMMVACIRLVQARRSDAHIEQAEADDRVRFDISAIGRIDEINLGILGRELAAAAG